MFSSFLPHTVSNSLSADIFSNGSLQSLLTLEAEHDDVSRWISNSDHQLDAVWMNSLNKPPTTGRKRFSDVAVLRLITRTIPSSPVMLARGHYANERFSSLMTTIHTNSKGTGDLHEPVFKTGRGALDTSSRYIETAYLCVAKDPNDVSFWNCLKVWTNKSMTWCKYFVVDRLD